jgi:transposase-like protein
MEDLNLATLPKYLSDEESAWELLERLRWPEGRVVCPHCGVIDPKHYFIAARSGERTTRTGKTTFRRVWRCRHCRKQFSVLVGTIFESSKVPISKWLLAMWLFSAGKNGVSAKELQRHLGIAYQSAWFMAHRLREAATRKPLATLLSGTVVVDETFMGGKPENRHWNKDARGKWGRPLPKTPVVALVSGDEVRAQVIANVNGRTLRKAIQENVDMARSTLHTDGHQPYRSIGADMAGHVWVDHTHGEYVRDGASTNAAESFFAQMKRSITGTHHNVSKEHLHRYVNEFAFRWNTRKLTDGERVQAMVDATVGKRLTYRPLTDRQ